jgi:hypothetical protein
MDEVLKLLQEINGKLDATAAAQSVIGAKVDGMLEAQAAFAQHARAMSTFHDTLSASLAEIPKRLTAIEKVLDEATRPAPEA